MSVEVVSLEAPLSLNLRSNYHSLFEIKKEVNSLNLVVEEDQEAIVEIVNMAEFDKIELVINAEVKENASLKLVMVDFSASNVDCKLNSHVVNRSKIEVDLATVSALSEDKTFDLSVLQTGVDSYSSVKMTGVATDKASLQLLGTSDVKKGARNSYTFQGGTIVNLSQGGHTQVSPILKISENEIKAAHAAKLGKVSDETMFYLMSRGLSKKEAQTLLTIAYLKPVIDEISDENIKGTLLDYVEKRNF